MSQIRNTALLLKLHNVIVNKPMTLEEIMADRTIDPEVTFIHDTELSGKVISGSTVPVTEYYTLEDKLDYGSPTRTR
jgi:hypothetical protein